MMTRLFLALLLGCAVPRGALPEFDGSDSAVDGLTDSGIDSSFDSSIDAPGVDAPGVDAPMTDSGTDSGDAGDCGTIGVRSCDGAMLRECAPSGLVDVRTCLRGCAAGVCTAYDVRNVTMDRLLHVGTAGLNIAGGETVVLNTGSGEIVLEPDTQLRPPGVGVMNGISYERQAQGGAPRLGIFSFDSLMIDPGGTLRATGDDAPVILVGGEAVVDGTIDVSANARIGGPGATNGGTHGSNGGGSAGGESGETRGSGQGQLSGGGGGGHAGNGGMGGSNSSAVGGQGGMAIGDDEGTPLIGGGGGGGGASFFDNGSHGGGGGGAVQVSAGSSLSIGGVVRAAGAGGDAGFSAGGGGGAGGSIVLEAPRVDIAGVVAANGGGGGGGQGLTFENADSGENGRDDRTGARGGNGVAGGGNGGQGGAGGSLAGGNGTSGGPAAGGGGAAGRVSLYAESGGFGIGGTLSPNATMGDIP